MNDEDIRLPLGSYEDVVIDFFEESDFDPTPNNGYTVEHCENLLSKLKIERETFNLSEEETRKLIDDEYQKNSKAMRIMKENLKSLKEYQKQTMRAYGISLGKEMEIVKVRNKSIWDKKAEKGQFYLALMDSLQRKLSETEKELAQCEALMDILRQDLQTGSNEYIESQIKRIDKWIALNEGAIKNRKAEIKLKKKYIKEIKLDIEQAYVTKFNI